MLKHKRRSVIKLAGRAAAVASTGMAGILASGRTPAYAQQKTVHWLRWVDFVPASDQLWRKELVPQAEKELGMKLKEAGHPIGQTLGHTCGDAPTFTYPYMWSWGGKEVEADGKTVAINSKETIESVKFMSAFWKEARDEGALAWDG